MDKMRKRRRAIEVSMTTMTLLSRQRKYTLRVDVVDWLLYGPAACPVASFPDTQQRALMLTRTLAKLHPSR